MKIVIWISWKTVTDDSRVTNDWGSEIKISKSELIAENELKDQSEIWRTKTTRVIKWMKQYSWEFLLWYQLLKQCDWKCRKKYELNEESESKIKLFDKWVNKIFCIDESKSSITRSKNCKDYPPSSLTALIIVLPIRAIRTRNKT